MRNGSKFVATADILALNCSKKLFWNKLYIIVQCFSVYDVP